ncbi:golgin subfamily B member 1-like isoform X2 [Ornithodoros turicata]|uniref:golgin subfamily B member 1-like isoform X2 n=1 Tax=Ornithodoros turicata TaxID=34597 RepID=UPI003138B973
MEDQQEFLIQQLKDLLRTNEERLQQKERELEETNAKFQKFKLQSKAKLQQLTSKVKTQDAQATRGSSSPDVETTSEDASSTTKSTETSEQSSRGRMLILKRQLEEARLQFQKKEQEMQNSKKNLETMVEQLQSQVLQRDQIIMDLGASGDSPQATASAKKPELTPMEENKLYAHMVYKDSKILELNNQITELEGKIMDLQENLKEKDEVLQARNKAIQLMTGDLSLRNKAAVDELDETRAEMRNMQQDFLTRESSWKEQKAHLQEQLAVAETRLQETQESLQRLEATRFDLAARNAELQQKVVMVQEAFEKRSVESEKALQGKLDAMTKQLQEKTAELEAVQSTLKQTVSQSDAKILKARAMERRRAKALEGELEQLKKGVSNNEELTSLQQQVAELEEEKGAIQLKMLEMEEALSTQASRLEGMEEKASTIAELESQVKAAQDEKISLEMRAAEFEEQRELAERRMQSIQQELEAIRNTTEAPVPHLETEIKMALEEEVKKLNAVHMQDEIIIGELKEKLNQQVAASKELEQNLEDLKGQYGVIEVSLQAAQTHIEGKDKEVEELMKSLSDLEKALSKELGEKEKLHVAFTRREEETQKVLHELGLSSIEEVSSMVHNMSAYKAKCESLTDEIKTKMAENRELTSKAEELHQAKQDLDNLRRQLKNVEDCFQYLSVMSVDEIKTKWDNVQQDITSLNAFFEAEKARLNATLMEQSGEIKTLKDAMVQKEEAVRCLDEELRKWQSECESKDHQLSEMKICLDKAEKEVHFLRESSCNEEEKVKSKIASLLEQSADLEREVARLQATLEEKDKLLEGLEEQLRCSTVKAENLTQEMQKLQCDYKAKEEVMKQEFEMLLHEKQSSMEVVESYKLTVSDLEKRLCVANENLAKVMSSSEKQVRKLEAQVACTHADLQAKCTEYINLESSLAKKEEERRSAFEKIDVLTTKLNEIQDIEVHLKEKLNVTEAAHSEMVNRFHAETEKADKIIKQLEDTVREKQDLENKCIQLKDILTRVEHEAQQASHEKTGFEQNFLDISKKNEELGNTNNELLEQIEGLQAQLHDLETKSVSSITELQKNMEMLNNERVSLEERCCHLEEERDKQNSEMQECSRNYSDAVAKLEKANKQNEQLKARLKKVAKEVNDTRSKLKEVETTSSAQHGELASCVEKLQAEKHALESLCTQLENKVSENQQERETLTNSLYEMESSNDSVNVENMELKQQISLLLQECDNLKQQCHNAVTANSSKMQELNDTIEFLQTEKAELERHFVGLQASNRELSQEITVMRARLQEACLENEQLKQQQNELQSEMAHTRQELLDTSEALEDARHTKTETQEKCALLHEAVIAKQKEIDDAVRVVHDTEDMLNSARAEKEQLSSQISALQSWQSKTEGNLQEARQDKDSLLASEAKLQELLEVKNRELNNIQVMLSSREAELNALKDNAETEQSQLLIKMSEQAQVMEQQSGELELVRSELSACRGSLAAVQEDLTHHTGKLLAAEQANKELLEEMGNLRVKIEEASEQVALKDDSLQKMSEQRQILKNSVEKLTAERLELQEKLRKMVELEEQCNSRNLAVAELEKEVKEKCATIEQLLTDLDESKKGLSHLATVSENRVRELEEQVEGYKLEEKRLHDSEHALQDELALLREQKLEVDKVMEEMNKQSHITAEELKASLELTATLQSELEKTREEFLDTKRSLEEEVSGYAAKVNAQDEYSQTLEAQLDSLRKERQGLEHELRKRSDEVNSYRDDLADAIAMRDRSSEEHEVECQKLKAENQRRLQELEMQNQATATRAESQKRDLEANLAEAKEYSRGLQQQLECSETSAKDAMEKLRNDLSEMKDSYDSLQEHARCLSKEIERLKEEQVLKASHPDTTMGVQGERNVNQMLHDAGGCIESAVIPESVSELTALNQCSEDLPTALKSAHETIQQQLSRISKQDEEIRELNEELLKARKVTQEHVKDEGGYKEEQHLQTKGPSETLAGESSSEKVTEQQTEKAQRMGAELQKLKLAFKKSRGELRLKVKILEDRTRELEELKEQNLNLQSDFQKTVETLADEKHKAKQLVYACGEHEKEIEALKDITQRLTVECQSAQTELSAASEALALKSSQHRDMESRLHCSSAELEAAMQHIQQIEHEKERCTAKYEASVQEVEQLRTELEKIRVAAEGALQEKTELLTSKSEEVDALRSEMECTRNELERLSAEHSSLMSSTSKQDDSVHGELDTLNTDIQRLNTENAEMMRLKAEEVDALQEGLQFLKDDLTKYIDIANEKSQEVELLQERLDSSQASLDKLLGEFSVLHELLLQDNESDVEQLQRQVDECGLAESVRMLVSRERANTDMLKNLLHKQAQDLNAAQQEVLKLQKDVQGRDTDFKQCLLCLHALLQKSCEFASEHTATDDLDWMSLLANVKAKIQCLHEENHQALQDATNYRMLAEELQSQMESLSSENTSLMKEYNSVKELYNTTLQGVPENMLSKIDGFCQTDLMDGHEALEKGSVESTQEKEKLQSHVLVLETELAELRIKQETSEMQQAALGSSTVKNEEIKKELAATKVKSGRMLTKLKMFKEKTEKMEEEIKRLHETNKELEERRAHQEECQKEDMEKRMTLEDRCKALEEQLASRIPQHDYDRLSEDLLGTSKRLQELEREKDELSDQVRSLNDRNRQLEVEAAHLVSQLSVLKEQAEMLSSDNESFQSLVETLTHSRQTLEHELRSQQEQHTKAVKELENKLSRNADEFKAVDTKLTSLTSEHEILQGKYNEIVYKYRNLEEQFHFACEEKNQLKQRLAELEDECTSVRETAAVLKQQASATERESAGFADSLKQEHEELKQQFHRLKSEHQKAEERLVSAAAHQQHSTTLETQLENANSVISSLKETSKESVQEIINLRRETDELKNSLASSLEQFNEKENKWTQERNQLKHIEEHLKEASQKLSDELEELKAQHEEALHSKLQLRSEMEELQKEKKALAQQVQNWRSYIKDIEHNQSLGTNDPETAHLKRELEHTAKTLHQIGLQNETLIADLNKALEEKKHLQQELAGTQGTLQAREAQILQLHSNISSSSDSYVINMEPTPQPLLEQKLLELQQTNEVLLGNWRLEQQRRRLIEDELDSSVLHHSRTAPYNAPSESHLLLREGAVKIPETNYSITRQFKSHAYKLRRWFQGRQRHCQLLIRRRKFGPLALGFYLVLIHLWLLVSLL